MLEVVKATPKLSPASPADARKAIAVFPTTCVGVASAPLSTVSALEES